MTAGARNCALGRQQAPRLLCVPPPPPLAACVARRPACPPNCPSAAAQGLSQATVMQSQAEGRSAPSPPPPAAAEGSDEGPPMEGKGVLIEAGTGQLLERTGAVPTFAAEGLGGGARPGEPGVRQGPTPAAMWPGKRPAPSTVRSCWPSPLLQLPRRATTQCSPASLVMRTRRRPRAGAPAAPTSTWRRPAPTLAAVRPARGFWVGWRHVVPPGRASVGAAQASRWAVHIYRDARTVLRPSLQAPR